MKFLKNISMVLMAMVMAVCSITTVAMAADVGDVMPNPAETAELVGVEYN